MSMTAQEWIDNMGAGFNFGNTLEVHIGNDYHQMKRFYTSYVTITYGESTSKIIDSFTIGTSTKTASITLPEMDSDDYVTLNIYFSNPKLITTEGNLGINISNFTLLNSSNESIDLSSMINTYECDPLTDGSTLLSLNIGETATEISSGILNIKYSISTFPKSNDTELKVGLCHNYIPTGTPELTKWHIYAVYAAGFKSIRFPITWMNHTDNDTYMIDKEWLDYVANFVDYAIELGMEVVINLHHDDNSNNGGWLMSDKYITDTDMQNKYKAYWTQIGEYFADRSDKLAFAGYNETRGSDGSWDTTKSDNLYGIIKIGEDFYNTIRSISGNENRVLVFPTYAAKYNTMGSFTNTELNTTQSFHLPSNDDKYCCAEVHIYETNPDIIKKQIDSVINYNIPFFIGEYGISKDSWNNIDIVRGLQYLVSYSRYNKIGTFLWDDYGNMGCLIRTSAYSEKTASNPKIWRGYSINSIQYICKCGILTLADIKTEKRLETYITQDIDQLYLDTKTDVIYNVIDGSDYGSCTLSGEFHAGKAGVCTILGVSADGYYNTISLTINNPTHFIDNEENLITDTSVLLFKKSPSEYTNTWDKTKSATDINRYLTNTGRLGYNGVIPVQSSSYFKISGQIHLDCSAIEGVYRTISFCPYCIELDSNGNLLVLHKSSKYSTDDIEFYTASTTKYMVIGFLPNDSLFSKVTSLSEPKSITNNVKITSKVRDMDYDEHPSEERYIKLSNFSKYDVCLRREFNIVGGLTYKVDFGIDCNIQIIEFNKRNEKINESNLSNGDSIDINIFTTKILLIFFISSASYYQLIKNFNNKSLVPKFIYNDYIENNDESIHEDLNKGNLNLIKINGKLLSHNGKIFSY